MSGSEDIEVKYKKLIEAPHIKERINEVVRIETRYAIIMVINTFGSSNIKKFARILGKNEATVYHHIKEMLKEPAFLKIDESMTTSHKGIYYKLTDLAYKHFREAPADKTAFPVEKLDELLQKSDEEITQLYVDLLAKHPDIGHQAEKDRKRIAYNHILENIMLNNLERAEKALRRGAKPKNKRYPFGSLSNTYIEMKIAKPRHLFEILKQTFLFELEMYKLNENLKKEMDNDKIPEEERIDLHFHLVGGEIADFEFE